MSGALRIAAVAILLAVRLAAPARADSPLTREPELLHFEQADYPAEALAGDLEASVLLELDVAADGTVSDARVVELVGLGFDEAALAAARRFVFRPAEADGAPVAVRIHFVYEFTIGREVVERPPPATGVIRGQLLLRGGRGPAAGVVVVVPEHGLQAVSGDHGRFELTAPVGEATVLVPASSFEEASAPVVVREGATDVTLYLRPDPYAEYRTVIAAAPVTTAPRTVLEVAEINKIPGTSGDALRAIQNLPGTARAALGSGMLVMRGSAPEDTAYRVDGMYIPQLYHFVGVTSVFSSDLLEDLAFSAGGFGVTHGNGTAGLVEVSLRGGRADRWGGYGDLNVFHASAFASGPVWEGGTLTLAARRTWIDAVLPAILPEPTFTRAPAYYDYQALLDTALGPRDSLRVFAFGSDDQVRLVLSEPSDDNPAMRGAIETHLLFHGVQARWVHELGRGDTLATSIQGTFQQYSGVVGPQIDYDVRVGRIAWREDLTLGRGDPFTVRVGLDSTADVYCATIRAMRPPREGGTIPPIGSTAMGETDEAGVILRGGVYLEGTASPHENLTLTAGARLDAYGGIWQAVKVDPRASLRWRVGETTALKAAVGLYHRRPDDDELYAFFGSRSLTPERSVQVSAGIEQTLYEGLSLDVQGFYKDLSSLVAANPDPAGEEPLVSAGTGRAFGGEVLLRQAAGQFIWGWVSYTLSRSEREDHPGAPTRLFDFDQTHVLTAVVSATLPWDLTLGVRYRYATGNPTTPVVGAVFDGDVGVHHGVLGPVNGARLPDFHQLDLRLDKRWLFEDWALTAYLEAQNLTNHANAEGMAWQHDYRRSEVVTGLPILPGFGLRGEL
ncbi:MAG: TonB-dependent receptor [Myxococcales bacterium]